jgi:Ca2+-binding EF-hand superfamily protein
LTERKKKIVDKAFEVLDRTDKGYVTVKDIINIYDVSKDKDFISGKKSKE